MPERLIAGAAAPDFTLKNAEGQDVSLSDFRGRNTVVYFYPAAATPGCTKQACDFRDSLAACSRQVTRWWASPPTRSEKLARSRPPKG